MEAAEKAADKALSLDPNLGEACAAKGAVEAIYHWNWEVARSYFHKAIELSPNPVTRAWLALLHGGRGEHEEARAAIDSALNLSNHPAFLIALSGRIYYLAKQYEDAIRECDEGIESVPDLYLSYVFKAQTLRSIGRYEEAEENFLIASRLTHDHPTCIAELGHLYAKVGKIPQMEEKFEQLREIGREMYCSPYLKAHIYLGGAEKQRDFRSEFYKIIRHEVIPTRSGYLIFFKSDPIYDCLRDDTRFQSLLSSIKLFD
jgi:tetratricopeptide (TPR) repeat protein